MAGCPVPPSKPASGCRAAPLASRHVCLSDGLLRLPRQKYYSASAWHTFITGVNTRRCFSLDRRAQHSSAHLSLSGVHACRLTSAVTALRYAILSGMLLLLQSTVVGPGETETRRVVGRAHEIAAAASHRIAFARASLPYRSKDARARPCVFFSHGSFCSPYSRV